VARIFASIDLGGTNTACALASDDGAMLVERTIPTLPNQCPDTILDRITATLEAMAEEIGERPDAVGMGAPGLVDRAKGTTLFLPNLATQWRGVAVAQFLNGRLGCPVYLLNDVRIATLGEMTFGLKCKTGTMVFVAIGTGIGGGIVVDGRLRLGPLGAAGELGHQTILPDGPLCGCGNHGCLEALASGPAITAEGVRMLLTGMAPRLYELTGGRIEEVNPKSMAAAAAAGDEAIREAIVRAASYLGIGIANMVTALHPDLVVLGGGVSATGALLIDTVRTTVGCRVRMFPVDNLSIENSVLGDKAGIYGGIALAMRKGEI
jgi:glucokinase